MLDYQPFYDQDYNFCKENDRKQNPRGCGDPNLVSIEKGSHLFIQQKEHTSMKICGLET